MLMFCPHSLSYKPLLFWPIMMSERLAMINVRLYLESFCKCKCYFFPRCPRCTYLIITTISHILTLQALMTTMHSYYYQKFKIISFTGSVSQWRFLPDVIVCKTMYNWYSADRFVNKPDVSQTWPQQSQSLSIFPKISTNKS